MSTEIINTTKNKIFVHKIKETVQRFLEKYKIPQINVTVHIVDEIRIRELNKTFRKINRATDVLSFPQIKSLDELKDSKVPIQTLGDILICYKICQKQAKELRKTTNEELLFLVEHGLKHLIGKHHK